MAYDAFVFQSEGMARRAERARKRSDMAFRVFSNYYLYCQEVARLFWPERANFTEDRTPGIDLQEDLFTGAPQVLRRDLANRLGNATRPGRDWARLIGRPEEMMTNDGVRLWCDGASRTHQRILYDRRANYAHTKMVGDNDYVTFGNAVSICAYNERRDGLVFMPRHLKDCAWVTDANGMVNELFEKMKMRLEHAARLFGKDKLPSRWRKMMDQPGGDMQEVNVIRAAYPIRPEDFADDRKPAKMHRYVVAYIVGDDSLSDKESGALAENYCGEFPYNVRRWMPLDPEPFGRSPVTTIALADGRRMNVAEMSTLKAIEWAVEPPMWAEEDAVVSSFELRSGGITFVNTENMANSRDPIGQIQVGDPRYGEMFLERKRTEMTLQFYETLWKLPEREMTAFETAERLALIVQEAAPVFQPMESDLSREQDTVFDKASRAPGGNAYVIDNGEPPDELVFDGTLDWEFETFVSATLRKVKAQRARDVVMHVAEGRSINPSYGDHVNWDDMEREAVAGIGAEGWVLDRESVDALRRQRAEAERQAQMEEDMAQTAEVLAKANPENLKMLEDQR